MNNETINIDFKHRLGKPSSPIAGWFYWVEREEDKPQIWFAINTNPDDMILLSDEVGESLKQRLEEAEGNIEGLQETLAGIKQEILDEIEDKGYLTTEDLEGYAKLDDIPDGVELTDSDYDAIAERVNEKTFTLKWKEI